jgi:hypothetical protein
MRLNQQSMAQASSVLTARHRQNSHWALFCCSVIKIILQFCKENGLTESFSAIQVM